MRYIILLLTALMLPAYNQTWLARYNGPANDDDQALGITVDDSGYVYVTGTSWGLVTSYDYATVKYNSSGEQVWSERFDGAAHGSDEARAITANRNHIIVTGGSADLNLYTDILTIAYNTDGSVAWTVPYNDPNDGNDFGLGITNDSNENVYVTGYASGSVTGWDIVLVKYNSSGAQQWVGTYSTEDEDYAVGVAVAPEGDIYVVGSSGNPYYLTWDYVTIRFNGVTGETIWTRRYNGPGDEHDEARAIALDSDGNVYVTGGSRGVNSGPDFTTIKYSPNGESLWVRRYNGPANGADWANAIAIDADNNIYVTGNSQDLTNDYDYVTVKYDVNGNQQWVSRYDGPAHSFDEAKAIVVDNDGNVYVTGASTGSGTRSDYATVKYDATGNEEWVHRYDGPASRQDEAIGIALDQTGGVCVTGNSVGNGSGNDYATLRYSLVGIKEDNEPLLVGVQNFEPQLIAQPNPFAHSTLISYNLVFKSYLTLTLHDITGSTIATLAKGEQEPGNYNINFSAPNFDLPKGVYFIHLKVNANDSSTKNQIRLRRITKLILAN